MGDRFLPWVEVEEVLRGMFPGDKAAQGRQLQALQALKAPPSEGDGCQLYFREHDPGKRADPNPTGTAVKDALKWINEKRFYAGLAEARKSGTSPVSSTSPALLVALGKAEYPLVPEVTAQMNETLSRAFGPEWKGKAAKPRVKPLNPSEIERLREFLATLTDKLTGQK